jgi:hypothetical protein
MSLLNKSGKKKATMICNKKKINNNYPIFGIENFVINYNPI